MEELKYKVDLLDAVNRKLTTNEKMYRLICDVSSSAYLYCDLSEGKITTLAKWEDYFPFSVGSVSDFIKFYDVIEEDYIAKFRSFLFPEHENKKNDSIIVKLKNSHVWIEGECTVIYDKLDNPTDKVLRFSNVSKLKSQNDELTYMAYYDLATGLYNRNYFVRLMSDFVRKASEEKAIASVMFIDIKDFRKINDGIGIIAGDELMQQFGQFLSGFQNDNVLVSHFGGDVYCIGIYDPFGSRSCESIFEQIKHRVKKPFALSTGHEISVNVCCGVAEYPEAAKTTLELINCAEIMMFKAKNSTKDEMYYFDAPVLEEFLNNVSIENKLKKALFQKNFFMNFQPQYYTDTKKLRGFEALIRWKDEDKGMISPASFIPIAEKNGAIVPIGTWVLEESIHIFSRWRKTYNTPFIISLNVSAIQYKRTDFVAKLIEILEKYDVNPKDVELEITETVLIDDFKEITEKLVILRDYGFKISMDDFGTGFSSLSYLKGLPIDTLKIDKSFIDTVTTDKNTRIITEAIVNMVQQLGYETIAEGVENEQQYEYLKGIGCDCIQGYLLGKPLSVEDVEKLLIREL